MSFYFELNLSYIDQPVFETGNTAGLEDLGIDVPGCFLLFGDDLGLTGLGIDGSFIDGCLEVMGIGWTMVPGDLLFFSDGLFFEGKFEGICTAGLEDLGTDGPGRLLLFGEDLFLPGLDIDGSFIDGGLEVVGTGWTMVPGCLAILGLFLLCEDV